ncbi:MAG: hypothetical protein KME26_06600 [Oscillatoria princeps RMCB-10]|jgi:hypothetical protein|nr:hypothetical protein [Oscillatoria princeps RMCB-10]
MLSIALTGTSRVRSAQGGTHQKNLFTKVGCRLRDFPAWGASRFCLVTKKALTREQRLSPTKEGEGKFFIVPLSRSRTEAINRA